MHRQLSPLPGAGPPKFESVIIRKVTPFQNHHRLRKPHYTLKSPFEPYKPTASPFSLPALINHPPFVPPRGGLP